MGGRNRKFFTSRNARKIRQVNSLSLLSAGASLERRSLLKSWVTCVFCTAAVFALISGVKDIKALVTTALSAGSLAFSLSVIVKEVGEKSSSSQTSSGDDTIENQANRNLINMSSSSPKKAVGHNISNEGKIKNPDN